MLLIQTRLGPSSIHGLGVMAAEPVRAGQPIWRFEPDLDLVLPLARLEGLPPAFRAYLDTYAYAAPEFPGSVVLSCDHAKFLNHAEDPNTEIRGRETFASRDIAVGQEITCDYRSCVSGWTGLP
jgi:SET domain-containing protein